MSIVAAKELEDAASKYAAEAIRVDSQGAHGRAIVLYQKAISTLIRLAQLYPDYKLNKLYLERSMAYQERIKALQSAHGSIPHDDSQPDNFDQTEGGSQSPQVIESLKASYNDLVLKEKPNVKNVEERIEKKIRVK